MTQSCFAGLHVALVMDGNGRWAVGRGLPRVAGHRAGAETARAVIRAAPKCGVGALTLYGFSSDNWKRPEEEVAALMGLLRRYLLAERVQCARNGVRMTVIGRRDRLAPEVVEAIEAAERETAGGRKLLLRLAVDYSARDAIVRAAGQPAGDRESFRQRLAAAQNCECAPDVDLLIRTGGEQRLSDFLLWECAYTEFFFLKKMWPEFTPRDLAEIVAEFHGRDRRYGMIKTEYQVPGTELRVAGD
jgi:undecaprenyl diphosphate synthase